MARRKLENDEQALLNEEPLFKFRHPNISHSCVLFLPNNKSIEINEGKIETSDYEIVTFLRKNNWIDLTPITKKEIVKKRKIVEWHYKVPNANNENKLNGNVSIRLDSDSYIEIQVIDNIVKTKNENVSEKLSKSGWILISSIQED